MARKKVKGKSKKGMSRLTKGLVKAGGIIGGSYIGAMGGSLAGGIVGGAVGGTTRNNPLIMGAGAVGGSLIGAVAGGLAGAKKGSEEAGQWITMRGRHTFIKNKKGAKAVVKRAKGK